MAEAPPPLKATSLPPPATIAPPSPPPPPPGAAPQTPTGASKIDLGSAPAAVAAGLEEVAAAAAAAPPPSGGGDSGLEGQQLGGEAVAAEAGGGGGQTHEGASAPRKRIERVARHWTAEDPSQMNVVEGDFVVIWIDTGTDHGWIHTERHSGATQVGWLPVVVLQQLPENRRWMRTSQKWEALDESQCSVEEGAYVVVWANSKTSAGWTYVDAVATEGSLDQQPGWLPVFCLEWTDD